MKNLRKKNLEDFVKKENKNFLSLGNCIKVKDSLKTYQVIGINQRKKICWVREWPLNFKSYSTFEVPTSKIILSTFCQIKSNK